MRDYLKQFHFLGTIEYAVANDSERVVQIYMPLPFSSELNVGVTVKKDHLEYHNSDGKITEDAPQIEGLKLSYVPGKENAIRITTLDQPAEGEAHLFFDTINRVLGYYELETMTLRHALEDVKRFEKFPRIEIVPYNANCNTPVYSFKVHVLDANGKKDGYYAYILLRMDEDMTGVFSQHKEGSVKLYLPNSKAIGNHKAIDDFYELLARWEDKNGLTDR